MFYLANLITAYIGGRLAFFVPFLALALFPAARLFKNPSARAPPGAITSKARRKEKSKGKERDTPGNRMTSGRVAEFMGLGLSIILSISSNIPRGNLSGISPGVLSAVLFINFFIVLSGIFF